MTAKNLPLLVRREDVWRKVEEIMLQLLVKVEKEQEKSKSIQCLSVGSIFFRRRSKILKGHPHFFQFVVSLFGNGFLLLW
jgi:hypothetical protein